jgi:hypothetical protein
MRATELSGTFIAACEILSLTCAKEKKQLLAAFVPRYRIPEAMNPRRHIHAVMLVLFVTMMTNAFSWAFNGEVFAHELDHEHHVLSLDPTAHLEAHQHAAINDEGHLDAATHLCLHAAGQYQPFFFTAPLTVPAFTGMEVPGVFVSAIVPESIPESPLHPPRNLLVS